MSRYKKVRWRARTNRQKANWAVAVAVSAQGGDWPARGDDDGA